MRCRKIQRLLETYRDDGLNAIQNARVEKHLARCQRCADTLETSRKLQCILRQQTESTEPENHFADRVVAQARDQNMLGGAPPRRYLLWFWMTDNPGFRKAVAAAGLVVGLTAGLLVTGMFRDHQAMGSNMPQAVGPQQETTQQTYGVDYFSERPQGSLPDALFSLVAVNDQRRN